MLTHPTIRILIVEDQQLFLELLKGLCEREFGFTVAATAVCGGDAIRLAREVSPDVILLDLNLPDMDGVDVALALLSENANRRILALSSQIDDYTLHRVLSSAIKGYVDKNEQSIAVLKKAIHQVATGGVFFTEVIQEVRNELRRDPMSFPKVLSDREQELVALLGRGLDDTETAAMLGLKPLTIQSHRRNILRKLNLSGTKQLVRYAVAHGFVRQPTRRS